MTAPKKPVATKRKPATRKTTTKRTPAPRKKVVLAPSESEGTTSPPIEVVKEKVAASPQERQAKADAYFTLKQAGLTPPAELAIEVEGWIAEQQANNVSAQRHAEIVAEQRQNQIADANINGPFYVRNGFNGPFNIRLDRQTEKRRIQLKPRGEPGDLHPLKEEDLNDPVLRQNVSLGLCEVIPAGEAQQIINNQTNNMGQRVHAPLAVLRNEYNEAYKAGAVRVEAEFNSQGVTVAAVDPRALQGQMSDRELGGTRSTGGITRVQPGQPEVTSGFVPTAGNPAIISQGGMSPEAQARAQADIANRGRGDREANFHRGPGDLTVTVDPVQRT